MRSLMESSDELLFSRVSLWEMAVKVAAGKSNVELKKFADEVTRLGVDWLDVTNSHIFEVARLPYADHKDPFDRLLVAQASSEGLTLLTADRRLQRYGEFVHVV